MTTRRRRNLFPGVPAPGDRDPDVTHAYPGLADELRAEVRREPAMLDLADGGLRKGDTVSVDLGDGEPTQHVVDAVVEFGDGVQREGRVTLTPLHDGLRDESRDLAPADVEAWRDEQRGASVAPELVAALRREPEPAAGEDGLTEVGLDEAVHPVWGGSPPFAPERAEQQGVDLDEWAAEPQPDEGHRGPEWRRVVDSTDEPVEVRLGCGCRVVLYSCTA